MRLPFRRGAWAALIIAAVLMTAQSVTAQSSPDEPPGRARFVPADQLADVFATSPRGVFLPRDEYLALVAKARAARQRADDVPEPDAGGGGDCRIGSPPGDSHSTQSLALLVLAET